MVTMWLSKLDSLAVYSLKAIKGVLHFPFSYTLFLLDYKASTVFLLLKKPQQNKKATPVSTLHVLY